MSNRNNGLVATLFTFNDLIWSLLACFMVMTALLVTQISKTKTEKTSEETPAGSISVYAFWQDGIDVDIDLHLSSPSGDHVYFAKLSGKIWNLLRDDLGMVADPARVISRTPMQGACRRGNTWSISMPIAAGLTDTRWT